MNTIITTTYKTKVLIAWSFLAFAFIIMPVLAWLYAKSGSTPFAIKIIYTSFFAALSIYVIITFLRRGPKITFSCDGITVFYPWKKNFLAWEQVQSVTMHQKSTYRGPDPFRQQAEALVIYCSEHKKIVLFDDIYSNTSIFRQYLAQKVSEGIISDVHPSLNKDRLPEINFRTYKGNALLQFYTIVLLFLLSSFLLLFTSNNYAVQQKPVLLLVPVIMLVIFCIGFSYQMFYFSIQYDDLVIKNHYLFWASTSIKIDNIKELVMEQPYRKSISLRVITKDGQSVLFGAGSLRNRHWRALKTDMKFIGIPCRCDTDI
ncbi:MAG: hypothetical protein JST86_11740 [Bacteroidetes bacterium]|nr:hypothetical protein [Bacteroidota bacterium]